MPRPAPKDWKPAFHQHIFWRQVNWPRLFPEPVIAEIIGQCGLPEDQAAKLATELKETVRDAYAEAVAFQGRPSAKERKAALTSIHKHAALLADCLKKLDADSDLVLHSILEQSGFNARLAPAPEGWEPSHPPLRRVRQIAEALVEGAREASINTCGSPPGGSSNPGFLKQALAVALARAWNDATGTKPSLAREPTSGHIYGAFWSFAVKVSKSLGHDKMEAAVTSALYGENRYT